VFDLINGIPVHPLVVHAVVVLLPLAVVGAIVIAFVPRWRVRYGVLVVACAAIGTALVPVATSSGEALQERVGEVEEHAELGDQLIWFAVPFLILVAALVWLQWRKDRADAAGGSSAGHGRNMLMGVAVLAVIVGLANVVQIYRIGDSGAKAVWGNQGSSTL